MDGKVDYLNLFINSLVDDDRGPELEFMRPRDPEETIRIEHRLMMQRKVQTDTETVASGKVNRICEALKNELIKLNDKSNRFLLPILTVYVKK